MDYDAHLYTHIMGKKRGNGKSMSGWSYDHIQDLITIDPEVFELLRVIIPCLHEMREEAEEKYKMNKGTVLNKKKDVVDVRPIGCKNPFMSIAGHMARYQVANTINNTSSITDLPSEEPPSCSIEKGRKKRLGFPSKMGSARCDSIGFSRHGF